MALDADAIIDRRRLRRKVVFWRVAAFVVLAVALAGAIHWGGLLDPAGRRSDHIARVEISGVIIDDRARLKLLEDIAKSPRVKAVILDINSPGGSTVGGEALYLGLRRLAEEKPVVATIGTLGASAAYMAAIAADRIYARSTSLAGSIGVYIQYGNIKGLLDTVGVEMNVVRSGPLKAEPNFFDKTPEAVRQNLQAVIDDSYAWFVSRVAERRKMSEDAVRAVAQGGIYSGERAMSSGLVDAIGGEKEAAAWLAETHDLPKDLPVVTWKVGGETGSGLPFFSRMAHAFGSGIASEISGTLGRAGELFAEGVALDGLVSVWHAQGAADADGGSGGRE
ncbi:signal peptide peptidase SppA [Stappia sp.]|jgi:protease-4|uniref:signal peptide peptidase SppA n=1 Tax=Stappia sp. TaxID=1870903 RepID=UPI003A99CEDF